MTSSKQYQVVLGIGSNREREKHIQLALQALHDAFASAAQPMLVSRVFESDAVGFDGAAFYNLVAVVTTHLNLVAVSQLCKRIERQLGHAADVAKYSPRTIDIDILLYDDLICAEPVQLPRAEILTNAFVLWPLAELLPEQRHPETQNTFAQHWQNYSSEQQLQPIQFNFADLPHLKRNFS